MLRRLHRMYKGYNHGMNLGVLGLGFMGSTHIKAIRRIPGVRLAAVMDSDETRLSGDLSGIQGNLGGPGERFDFSDTARYRTPEEILADKDVQAVDICLPTFLHAPLAIQALRAGKHVLVEKPMALTGAEADRVCQEAAGSGRVLMVAHVLRFFEAYRELSRLVESGKLGAIRSCLFRRRTSVPTWGPWEFDKAKSGGGVFDLLIHDVDMALSLFGVPEAISSTGYEDMANGVDMVTSEFHYRDIGSVTISGGWHHVGQYPFSMEYTVVAERGVVEFNSAGRPATVYWANGETEALAAGNDDPYQAEIEHFIDCCRAGLVPEAGAPADSALAVKAALLMVEARQRRGEKAAFRMMARA
jgi:predicted dehydrogenase